MTARRACALGLLAALAALAGCATDRSPVAPQGASGPPVLLAFTSDRAPSRPIVYDVWFADLATGEAPFRPANVNSPSDEGPAALSGDGRTLAFQTSRAFVGTLAQLAVEDVETGALRLPAKTRMLFSAINPSLSYDGRYLAVNYQVGGPFDQAIACEDLKGDTLLPLPNINEIGATNFDPSLNGDGTLIAFASDRTGTLGGYDVVLYSVPGDTFIALPGLNSHDNDMSPSISSDGRWIAFQSGRPGGAGVIDVYLYDRQTASLVPLPGLNTEFAETNPALSPDGRWLACTTEAEGGRNIRLYDVVAKRLVPIPQVNDPVMTDQYPSLSDRPPRIAR